MTSGTSIPKPEVPWNPQDGNERILSIDIGITHLAYMLMDLTNVKILRWELVDLKALALNDHDYTVTYIGIRPAKRGFTDIRVADILAYWLDENILPIAPSIRWVLIEPQQTGQMRCICRELQIYFRNIAHAAIQKGDPPICVPTFISPKLRTQLTRTYLRSCSTLPEPIMTDEAIKELTRSQRYRMNKKYSVLMVKDVLTEKHPWRPWFMGQENVVDKLDDLADVLVQCLTYIQLRSEDEAERDKRKQMVNERKAARFALKAEERKRALELKEKQKAEKVEEIPPIAVEPVPPAVPVTPVSPVSEPVKPPVLVAPVTPLEPGEIAEETPAPPKKRPRKAKSAKPVSPPHENGVAAPNLGRMIGKISALT